MHSGIPRTRSSARGSSSRSVQRRWSGLEVRGSSGGISGRSAEEPLEGRRSDCLEERVLIPLQRDFQPIAQFQNLADRVSSDRHTRVHHVDVLATKQREHGEPRILDLDVFVDRAVDQLNRGSSRRSPSSLARRRCDAADQPNGNAERFALHADHEGVGEAYSGEGTRGTSLHVSAPKSGCHPDPHSSADMRSPF